MTDPTTVDSPERRPVGARSSAPPDPELYDSPRAVRARAKGLPGPYIEGGNDPDIGQALAEEHRLWRMLVIMVLAIVGAGFVIGTILALAGAGA